MGKYGSGITMEQMFRAEKDEIKQALASSRVKKETAERIIDAYDNAVYHAIQAVIGAKVLEEMMERRGIKMTKDLFHEYVETAMRIGRDYNTYEYEDEIDEDY